MTLDLMEMAFGNFSKIVFHLILQMEKTFLPQKLVMLITQTNAVFVIILKNHARVIYISGLMVYPNIGIPNPSVTVESYDNYSIK
jgi:hypothetical protein